MSRRQKLLYLCRCIPLVESNVFNRVSPQETGKTYLYRNISYYAHVLSGGKATPAQLLSTSITAKSAKWVPGTPWFLMKSPTPISRIRRRWSALCGAICRMPSSVGARKRSWLCQPGLYWGILMCRDSCPTRSTIIFLSRCLILCR